MSYQTSYKRSRPFWFPIGDRKRLCFSAQSERSRPWSRLGVLTRKVHELQLFAMFISAVRGHLTQEVKDSISKQNSRENIRNICDYFTGKYLDLSQVSYKIKNQSIDNTFSAVENNY